MQDMMRLVSDCYPLWVPNAAGMTGEAVDIARRKRVPGLEDPTAAPNAVPFFVGKQSDCLWDLVSVAKLPQLPAEYGVTCCCCRAKTRLAGPLEFCPQSLYD